MKEDEQRTMHTVALILVRTVKPEIVTARHGVAVGFAGVLCMTDHAAQKKHGHEDISKHIIEFLMKKICKGTDFFSTFAHRFH
jgi:hypothetical protein